MLQKPEKVGYNRVSRRQILRVLGIGVVIASAALLCAVDGDFCMGATLWALALCALYGGLESCPIF